MIKEVFEELFGWIKNLDYFKGLFGQFKVQFKAVFYGMLRGCFGLFLWHV